VIAALAGLYQLYLVLIYLGIVSFTVVGQTVSFNSAQWGYAAWCGLMMLIWFWVAYGFFTARLFAWMFGILIATFTLIGVMLSILGHSTIEAEFVPLALSVIVLLYLMYPGTREAFYESEAAQQAQQR